MDAIVKNVFRNNPAALAEWTSASHTERQPRRASTAPQPPPSLPQDKQLRIAPLTNAPKVRVMLGSFIFNKLRVARRLPLVL